MAVVTIPENPCGKPRKTCSEFDVYHPDLGQGQFKDLHRIQSIAPREADGQKLKECGTNMKLRDQREEGKEGTILLCSRFQHKPIHIHRQKVPNSNPPQQTDAHKSNDSQINLQNNSIHIPKTCFKDGHELRESDSQSSQKEKLVKFGNMCLLKRLLTSSNGSTEDGF
jgi:hypothetical protein